MTVACIAIHRLFLDEYRNQLLRSFWTLESTNLRSRAISLKTGLSCVQLLVRDAVFLNDFKFGKIWV